MKMKIEFKKESIKYANRRIILETIIPAYAKWKFHKSFSNYLQLVTAPKDERIPHYIFRFFYCAKKILTGEYEKIFNDSVASVTFIISDHSITEKL